MGKLSEVTERGNKRLAPSSGYLLAVAALAVVTLARWLLDRNVDPRLISHTALSPYYAVVVLAAWYGGWRPGLLSLVCGGLIADYFFIPPLGLSWGKDIGSEIAVLLYLGVGSLSILLIEGLHRSRHRAVEAQGEIVAANESLAKKISDSKLAEEALRDSETRKSAILESSLDAIISMDNQGRIVEWNPAAEQIFGRSRESILGEELAELVIPVHLRERHRQGLAHYLATGAGRVLGKRIEMPAIRADGSELQVELAICRISHCEPPTFTAFLRDITDRKLAEEELRQARDELEARVKQRTAELHRTNEHLSHAKEAAEAASRAKSAFLANMSHEIRTPMNAIIGMTELVLEGQLAPRQRDFLKVVDESSQALLRLINDILDFSKIEAGKVVLSDLDFDLDENLGDTMRALAIRAQDKGLELACRIRPDVPIYLRGDPDRLRQVVVNLVGNAIKFTPKGEVVLDVHREPSENGNVDLHFTVSDTGIGIPPEKQRAIFEVFEQADSTMTRRFGGSGLGLAIASRLVDLMQGRIWVESAPGRGSTFHFTARLEAASATLEPKRPGQVGAIRGTRVLVVDDNATNRTILDEILRSWDVVPLCVPGAAEAIRALRLARRHGKPYQLVITDAHMPQQSGFDLVEEIRRTSELDSTVIMMLTSGDHTDDVARCESLGIAAYMMKPIKQSDLFDAMALALKITVPEDLAAASKAAKARAIGPMKILLAEDSLVNQKLAVALLESQGHEVTIVGNGREAVAAASAGHFNAVLMDVQMPEMDGLEATAAIRARERLHGGHVPIIAMTAHALKGDRELCLQAGMDDYIPKPIHAEQLFDTLEALCMPALRGPEKAPAAESEIVNWNETLQSVDGNRQTLDIMVEAALDEFPQLLSALHAALANNDNQALRRAAHTLKGSLRYFTTGPAYQDACQLEQIGQEDRLADARHVLDSLDCALEQVILALDARHATAV